MKNKNQWNKKGDLVLKEVITLVISILCLIILFYLASQLYSMFINKSSLEQAKSNLDQIVNIVNKLEEGGTRTYLVTSPADWFIIVYSKGTGLHSCYESSCICFCPVDDKDNCENGGVCKAINIDTESKPALKLNAFYNLKFERTKNVLYISAQINNNKESR